MGFVEVLLELLFQIYFKFLIKMPPDESFVLLSQKYGHCIRKLLSLLFLLIMAMAGLDKFSLLSSLCLFPHLVLDIISYLDIKTLKNAFGDKPSLNIIRKSEGSHGFPCCALFELTKHKCKFSQLTIDSQQTHTL